MKKFVLLLVILCLATAPSSAATDPFTSLPTEHWAYGTLSEIAHASGADSSIKNGMTRYDCASALANILRDVRILSPREIEVCKTTTFERLILEFEPELDALGVRLDSNTWPFRFRIRLREEELERILARHSIKDRAYGPVTSDYWACEVVGRMIFLNNLNAPPPRRGSPEEVFYRASKPLNATNRYKLAAAFIDEFRRPFPQSATIDDLLLIRAFVLEFWDELDVIYEHFDKGKAYADFFIRYRDQSGFLFPYRFDTPPEEILRAMKRRGIPPFTTVFR